MLLGLLLFTAQDHALDDITLDTADGKKVALAEQRDAKAIVLVFIGIECPIANRCLPRLIDMQKKFAEKGVAFFAVNSNVLERPEAIAKHAKENALPFPVLLDRDGKLADALKATVTPTAIVLDTARAARYRGRID